MIELENSLSLDCEVKNMLNSDFKGRKCSGCGECKHADHNKMKCYLESEDCKSEYDLTEEDFHKEARCDFFHHK